MIPHVSSFWGVLVAGALGVGGFLLRLVISEVFHALAGKVFSRPARAIEKVLPTSATLAEQPAQQTVEDRLRAIDDLLAHGSIDAARHEELRAQVLRDA